MYEMDEVETGSTNKSTMEVHTDTHIDRNALVFNLYWLIVSPTVGITKDELFECKLHLKAMYVIMVNELLRDHRDAALLLTDYNTTSKSVHDVETFVVAMRTKYEVGDWPWLDKPITDDDSLEHDWKGSFLNVHLVDGELYNFVEAVLGNRFKEHLCRRLIRAKANLIRRIEKDGFRSQSLDEIMFTYSDDEFEAAIQKLK